MNAPRLRVTFRGPDGIVHTVIGQTARSLLALREAGQRGCTALEVSSWSFRFAAYCHDLSKLGLAIVTDRESHSGGWHGRHRLVSPATIIATEPAEIALSGLRMAA